MIVWNSKNKVFYADLVAAHKGLLKEKKTLETTLQVMTRGSTSTTTDNEIRTNNGISADDKVRNIYVF